MKLLRASRPVETWRLVVVHGRMSEEEPEWPGASVLWLQHPSRGDALYVSVRFSELQTIPRFCSSTVRCAGRLLAVMHTERSGAIRLISLREMTSKKARQHAESHA